jgi:hypothetical protein
VPLFNMAAAWAMPLSAVVAANTAENMNFFIFVPY